MGNKKFTADGMEVVTGRGEGIQHGWPFSEKDGVPWLLTVPVFSLFTKSEVEGKVEQQKSIVLAEKFLPYFSHDFITHKSGLEI
jgi:hypothetical protein